MKTGVVAPISVIAVVLLATAIVKAFQSNCREVSTNSNVPTIPGIPTSRRRTT